MGSLVPFLFSLFFFLLILSFGHGTRKECLREATLLGPGGSIFELEPVESALGCGGGGGGEERFRFQSDQPVQALLATSGRITGRALVGESEEL